MTPTDPRDAAAHDVAAGDSVRVVALRYDVTETTIRRWCRAAGMRFTPGRPPRNGAITARPDVYRPEPQTPRQRRLWQAWRAQPAAKLAALAREAGVTEGYASRLIGHWKAQQETGQ